MKHKQQTSAPNDQAQELSRTAGQDRYTAKRRVRKAKKGIKVFIVLLGLAVIGAAVGLGFYMSDLQGRLTGDLGDDLFATLAEKPKGEPFYMLLLGVDKSADRAGEYGTDSSGYRSDSIILARVDPEDQQVTMVSIHRDTLVNLGVNGKQKINAAYSLGGAPYAVEVVSKFAGVPITHYAEIDFDNFVKVVDDLGGIEVDVPIDINDRYAGEPIKAGLQTLNGRQALTLCRSRHAYDNYGDGDMYRAANQRMVISAIIKKVLAADPATMTATISKMADSVSTDMSLTDILSLADQMRGIDMDKDVYTGTDPTRSAYVNDTWYELCDLEAWREMMTRVDKGLSPYASAEDDPTGDAAGGATNIKNEGQTDSAAPANPEDVEGAHSATYSGTVRVLNAANEQGLAGRVAKSLETFGFTATADTAKNLYDDTVVVYFDEANKEKAETVAQALGGEVLVTNGTGVYADDGSDVLVVLGSDLRSYS